MKQYHNSNYQKINTMNKPKQQSNIYYKGMNKSTLELIQKDGVIKARLISNAQQSMNGVYVSQSESTARQYGEVILKMDLTGLNVINSPHSNQYICQSDVPYDKILAIIENLKPEMNNVNMNNQQKGKQPNYKQSYPGVNMYQEEY
jgi:hypothetical protein